MMVHICKNLEYNKIIQLHNGLSPHLTHSVISSAADPGGGSGGSRHDTLPLPPITCDTCFETDIDRIVYYFLPGWFYLMKRVLHFSAKLNSRDNKKCHCFLVHSSDLFTSARKALFFLPNGDKCPQITKHAVISVRSKLPQKKFNSPFWTKFWTPPLP